MERWLIDCGRQAPDQLHDAGLSWHDITGQIVTHVHGDHVYGLEDFAFMRYYDSVAGQEAVMRGGPRPKLIAHGAVLAEVWEFLAPSLRYQRRGNDTRAGTLEDYFESIAASEVEGPGASAWNHAERFECGQMALTCRESEHVPGKPSCSLELELEPGTEDGPLAWWSGDCTVHGDYLADLEPRVQIFFHDCTFVEYPGQVHGAFSLIEKLPRRVLDKMVLMHHEDDLDAHRERIAALDVRVALPGQRWDLRTGTQLSGPTFGD